MIPVAPTTTLPVPPLFKAFVGDDGGYEIMLGTGPWKKGSCLISKSSSKLFLYRKINLAIFRFESFFAKENTFESFAPCSVVRKYERSKMFRKA